MAEHDPRRARVGGHAARETPPTGSPRPRSQERVARGADQRDRRAHQPHARRDRPGQRVHPLQRDPRRRCSSVIVVVGPIQDATFGLVLVANARHRHRPGGARQAHARPPRGAERTPSPGRARRGRRRRSRWKRWCSTICSSSGPATRFPCDGVVRTADGLEVDESLLTGESDPLDKDPGDEVLSGSFVVAGSGRFQATRVGADSYAREARGGGPPVPAHRSELMDGINTILRIVTWVLIPTSALLLWSQLRTTTSTTRCAAPSPAWSAWCRKGWCCSRASRSWWRRSRWRAARCWCRSSPRSRGSRASTSCASTRPARSPRARSSSTRSNRSTVPTASLWVSRARRARRRREPQRDAGRAGRARSRRPGWTRTGAVPFSSARKWSAASFDGQGSWVMGAPEMVLTDASLPGARAGRRARVRAAGACSCWPAADAPLDGEELRRRPASRWRW